MDEGKEAGSDSFGKKSKNFNFSVNKKIFYLILIFLFVVAMFILASGFSKIVKENIHGTIPFCGDGSFPGTCSLMKPYYCNGTGFLVYDANSCGCPDSGEFAKIDGFCVSAYQTSPKEISLKYVLNGEEKNLNYEVYGGLDDYLSTLKQSITYSDGQVSSRADFKLNQMNEEVERNFLLPLVLSIQNLAPGDKDTQARIAISLVQNIPFGASNKTYNFAGQNVSYSRYPYQVLYDNEGVCGEKTELLAFILRELGYGVSFFYYQDENHEALGIKCPIGESFSFTGYCFVETTGPSIITDNKLNYVGTGKLNSVPKLFFISEGLTFGQDNFYEKNDADKLINIRSFIEKHSWIGPLKKNTLEKLTKKYGLVDQYYSG